MVAWKWGGVSSSVASVIRRSKGAVTALGGQAIAIADACKRSRSMQDGRGLTGMGTGGRRGCPVALVCCVPTVHRRFPIITILPFCYLLNFLHSRSYRPNFDKPEFWNTHHEKWSNFC